jgi:geranylgeranyl diphosphate synthase, type I
MLSGTRSLGIGEAAAYHRPMAFPGRRWRANLPPSLAEVGERAERRIIELLDAELRRWHEVDPDLTAPLSALRELVLSGGKRLRPAFCHWAFVGAGGAPGDPLVVDAGAALELLHTFALVHDDVMDGSDRRRGLPAIHRQFMTRHDAARGRGEARRFGEGAAILIGDFAFVYADVLFASVPAPARPIFDELRLELCVGQYLDLVGTASGSSDRVRAERIERYKSGKYTVERPLHLGAALAGRLDDLAGPLSAFGLPLGEAFQLRDDLLGVFGDAEVTGKPVGDDLREGKLTPLVAAAAARAAGPAAALLERLGSPDLTDAEIAGLQGVLVETGACDDVERAIDRLVDEALKALAAAPLSTDARVALEELGTFVAWRDR